MKFNSRETHIHDGYRFDVEIGGVHEHGSWYENGGWYEIFDAKSGGELFHEEGELELDKIDGKWTLTGYDGTFELHPLVIEAVAAQGIIIDL